MCHRTKPGGLMPYTVDFKNVSTVGLESSPVADALAGLRANEARYYKNKYDHDFTVTPAEDDPETLQFITNILSTERNLVIASKPLEVSSFEVDGLRMAYVFYESGLSINVMYGLEEGGKRAAGLQLQVRPAEVQACRHHPWLLLRDQGPVQLGPQRRRTPSND